MFSFVRNAIRHGRSATPTQNLYFLQKLLSRLPYPKFVSGSSNQHSFAVLYLINSCGLSPGSALQASKHLHLLTPENPDSVISILKSHGFSGTQISKLIMKYPRILVCSTKRNLLPKIEFFTSKGISSTNLVSLLSKCPYVVKCSLENSLIPTFNSLTELLQSSDKAIAMVTRFPFILYFGNVEKIVAIMHEYGVPDSNIIFFFRLANKWKGHSFQYFRYAIEFVKEKGVSPSKIQFPIAIIAMGLMGKSGWESKVNAYKKWGLSVEEVIAAFTRNPWFMIASEEKIMTMMDFYVNKMGWEPNVIAKSPVLLTFSLQRRIVPRALVLEFLVSNGLLNKKTSDYSSMFMCTEEIFLQKCVNRYQEAPQLLKLYTERRNL